MLLAFHRHPAPRLARSNDLSSRSDHWLARSRWAAFVQEVPLCWGGVYLPDAVHNGAWLNKAAPGDDRSDGRDARGRPTYGGKVRPFRPSRVRQGAGTVPVDAAARRAEAPKPYCV
jgi:hypothetical protein